MVGLVDTFRRQHPECSVHLVEVTMHDPVGPLLRHELDTIFLRGEVEHPDLCLGPEILRSGRVLGVHDGHDLATRTVVDAEELAGVTMLGIDGPAPPAWRHVASPSTTPSGREIPHGDRVTTFQEALASISAGRGAMVFPSRVRDFHPRPGVTFVPLSGLPPVSLRFVWHRLSVTAALKAFNAVVDAAAAPANPSPRPPSGSRA